MTAEVFNILVVDDDPTARETVTQFLRSGGFAQIQQAADGEQAMTLIKGGTKIDFIVSDWDMPKLNGMDLLKAVRATPGYEKIPFVIITSPISTEKIKIAEAAAGGVDGYLIKPFRRRMLVQKVSEVLFLRRLEANRGVLVVDDDEQVRTFISSALTQLGYSPVFTAKDGEEGFASLSSNYDKIALVLSDWNMPKVTGIEFLRKVRTTRNLRHTPFIMVTAQTDHEQDKLKSAIDAEVDHYLMKPFRIDDLKNKVEQVLLKAKADHERRFVIECGQQAIQDNEPDEAEKFFRLVLSKEAENVQGLLGLASVRLTDKTAKSIEEAIRLVERAIRLDPGYDLSYVRHAEALEAAMSVSEAMTTLKAGIKICPPSPELHYYLGRLLIRRGSFDEGNRELARALELNPAHEGAQQLYGFRPGAGGQGG